MIMLLHITRSGMRRTDDMINRLVSAAILHLNGVISHHAPVLDRSSLHSILASSELLCWAVSDADFNGVFTGLPTTVCALMACIGVR